MNTAKEIETRPRTYAEAAEQIYEVLKKHVPAASDKEISDGAYDIATVCQFAYRREPWLARRGTATAMKRLHAIHNHLRAACKKLEELGPDEKTALLELKASQAGLMEQVAAVNKPIVMAHRRLAERPLAIKGRSPDTVINKVSEAVGKVYSGLTGKQPTRFVSAYTNAPVGSFEAMLTEVLAVLGHTSSSTYRASLLQKKRKK
jgi:hypothetical protein